MTLKAIFGLFLVSLSASGTVQSQAAVGSKDPQLDPCPASPNCVCSQAECGDGHYAPPLRYQTDRTVARSVLVAALDREKRCTLVAQDDTYLHYECRSAIFRFVDDVEFSFAGDGLIHLRSAARLGYSDFGVNRRRSERIRQTFQQLQKEVEP